MTKEKEEVWEDEWIMPEEVVKAYAFAAKAHEGQRHRLRIFRGHVGGIYITRKDCVGGHRRNSSICAVYHDLVTRECKNHRTDHSLAISHLV